MPISAVHPAVSLISRGIVRNLRICRHHWISKKWTHYWISEKRAHYWISGTIFNSERKQNKKEYVRGNIGLELLNIHS